MAESSIPVLPSFIKKCCRVCGRSVDKRSRRTLFSTAGLRDKLSERLSTVTGIPIGRDELSEFVCRKCAAELDKYSRKAAEAENFKRGLIDKLSQTTLRHGSKEGSESLYILAGKPSLSIRQRFFLIHYCLMCA